ncbi:MAG: ABC transporter substrate-binding protein [Actinomycetota bacterium]
MRRVISSVAVVVVLAASAACGASSTDGATQAPPASPSPSASFPVTVEASNGAVTIASRPARIVSLSPTITEMLFAVGAGDQVEAVDEFSTFPDDAPVTELSGFEPNLEAVVSYAPDLVVLDTDAGHVVEGLARVGVTTLVLPAAASLDETYAQIELVGTATGHAREAAGITGDMRDEIRSILAASPPEGPTSVYHELDDTYYSVTSDTFIGQVYEMFGLSNIADEAKGAGSGYPQLSSEYIVQSDPAVIVLADGDCCGITPAEVASRPGWGDIAAVRTGSVIAIDDDIASRWGPRIVEFIRTVADALAGANG